MKILLGFRFLCYVSKLTFWLDTRQSLVVSTGKGIRIESVKCSNKDEQRLMER